MQTHLKAAVIGFALLSISARSTGGAGLGFVVPLASRVVFLSGAPRVIPVMRAHKIETPAPSSAPAVRNPAIYYPPPVRESGSMPPARHPVVMRRIPIMVEQYSGSYIPNGSDPLANLMYLQSRRIDPRKMRGVTRTVVPWFIMVPDR